MTAAFGIDFTRASSCQAQLVDATNKMRAEVSRLESEAQASLANWTGEAQANYHTLKQNWDSNMAAMAQLAAGHAAGLDSANQTLFKTEGAVSSMWQPGR